jgi:hypothetical protein
MPALLVWQGERMGQCHETIGGMGFAGAAVDAWLTFEAIVVCFEQDDTHFVPFVPEGKQDDGQVAPKPRFKLRTWAPAMAKILGG